MKLLQIILVILIVLLILASGYLGYTFLGASKQTPIPSAAGTPIPTQQTVFTGTMAPLPNLPGDTFSDPDGPPSGLKTANGDYYALVGYNNPVPDNGTSVTVNGQIDPTITIDHYNVKGVIRVNSITTQ